MTPVLKSELSMVLGKHTLEEELHVPAIRPKSKRSRIKDSRAKRNHRRFYEVCGKYRARHGNKLNKQRHILEESP